jgi:hypothetical protein
MTSTTQPSERSSTSVSVYGSYPEALETRDADTGLSATAPYGRPQILIFWISAVPAGFTSAKDNRVSSSHCMWMRTSAFVASSTRSTALSEIRATR